MEDIDQWLKQIDNVLLTLFDHLMIDYVCYIDYNCYHFDMEHRYLQVMNKRKIHGLTEEKKKR